MYELLIPKFFIHCTSIFTLWAILYVGVSYSFPILHIPSIRSNNKFEMTLPHSIKITTKVSSLCLLHWVCVPNTRYCNCLRNSNFTVITRSAPPESQTSLLSLQLKQYKEAESVSKRTAVFVVVRSFIYSIT